jgi:hypothetical protein
MKVTAFVSLSSVVLFAWLTATFVRVVPMDTYEAPLVTAKADPSKKLEKAVLAENAVRDRQR